MTVEEVWTNMYMCSMLNLTCTELINTKLIVYYTLQWFHWPIKIETLNFYLYYTLQQYNKFLFNTKLQHVPVYQIDLLPKA